jgi:hypothetical protein
MAQYDAICSDATKIHGIRPTGGWSEVTIELVSHIGERSRLLDDDTKQTRVQPYELVVTGSRQYKGVSSFQATPGIDSHELLVRMSKIVCRRYGLDFVKLTAIQRKFLTHYRCGQCGLLPLYHINYTHPKRVRCGRCYQSMSFRRTGKYGKMRKDIVIGLATTSRGGEAV